MDGVVNTGLKVDTLTPAFKAEADVAAVALPVTVTVTSFPNESIAGVVLVYVAFAEELVLVVCTSYATGGYVEPTVIKPLDCAIGAALAMAGSININPMT